MADQISFRNITKIKIAKFVLVFLIFIWGTDINLISLTIVTLCEKISKKFIQILENKKDEQITTLLSYGLALTIILTISIYEVNIVLIIDTCI